MRVLIGNHDIPRRRLTARWLWEPRDIYVGVFWNHAPNQGILFTLIYIALIPCFPIVLVWRRGYHQGGRTIPWHEHEWAERPYHDGATIRSCTFGECIATEIVRTVNGCEVIELGRTGRY